MIEIREIDSQDPGQVRRFVNFPFQLYRDCPQWVPPMAGDARLQLDRRRNPFYRHSDAAFFLASRHGRCVGRIAVLDHRGRTLASPASSSTAENLERQRGSSARDAFFYIFDCLNDLEAAQGLFETAAAWARRRGLAFIVGPVGFATGDPLGLLVEGFEHRAAMGIIYNHDYYYVDNKHVNYDDHD